MVTHKHHILPRHMGGTDDPSNIIELTVEEHALAHKKLWEDHGKWQDKIAWQMLSGQISTAEANRLASSNFMKNREVTDDTRKNMGDGQKKRFERDGHPRKGKTLTEESRMKMRQSHLGRPSPMKGKKSTPESIEKNRQANLNRPKILCQYCGVLISGGGNMKQHIKSKHQEI